MTDLSHEVKKLIEKFQLEAHPEGCFFRQTYHSDLTCKNTTGEVRPLATAIYFLMPEGHVSHLHRLKSDELWHFYLGSSLTVVQFAPDGKMEKIIVGSDISNGEKLQHTVPAGYWFGSYTNGEYSLVGCTVSPGFDYADFELAKRSEALLLFPHEKEEILKLTHE